MCVLSSRFGLTFSLARAHRWRANNVLLPHHTRRETEKIARYVQIALLPILPRRIAKTYLPAKCIIECKSSINPYICVIDPKNAHTREDNNKRARVIKPEAKKKSESK